MCAHVCVCLHCSVVFLSTQVTFEVSQGDERAESLPATKIQTFRSIPPPVNIVLTATNPRLKQLRLSHILDISMELSVYWEHPPIEVIITDYELYFSTGLDSLRLYDLYDRDSAGILVCILHISHTNKSLFSALDKVVSTRFVILERCDDASTWNLSNLYTLGPSRKCPD